MNIERLTMLQTLLTTYSSGKWYGGEPFEQNSFLCFKWPKKNKVSFNLQYFLSRRKSGEYLACAAGIAMLDKNFNALGFTCEGRVPVYKDEAGYKAVSKFFDIDMEVTKVLFSPLSYSSDCYKDPIWFLLRLDWLIHNSAGDSAKFLKSYATFGEVL